MPTRALLLTAAITTTVVAAFVAGCAGSDARSEAPAPVGPGGAGLTLTATDPCALATARDVASAFGGITAAGAADGVGGCAFSLSGHTSVGELAGAAVEVHVLVGPDDGTSVDERLAEDPELERIDGLGDGAWYSGLDRALHIDVGGADVTVVGVPGDPAAGRAAVLSLGQAIVSRLTAA